MREAEAEPPNAEMFRNLGGTAVEQELRRPAGVADDLELLPADAAADACAQSLGAGLLCGKAGGEAFRGALFAGVAVDDLAGGVDTREKLLPKAFQAAFDPCDLDEICFPARSPTRCLRTLAMRCKASVRAARPCDAQEPCPFWGQC